MLKPFCLLMLGLLTAGPARGDAPRPAQPRAEARVLVTIRQGVAVGPGQPMPRDRPQPRVRPCDPPRADGRTLAADCRMIVIDMP